ncbi:MAG TPA: hypothetical protein VIL42_05035 [Sphingomicrobium sp.]|jgi:hypothetical protein
MTCRIWVGLSAVFVMAAPAGAAAQPAEVQRTSARSLESFRDCFITSQDKAERPWAFVPDEGGGGTFSTVPAAQTDSPYFLTMRGSRSGTSLRLSGEARPGSGPTIAAAVEGCAR